MSKLTCKFVLLFPNFRLYDPFSVTPHQPSLSLGYLAGMLDKFQIPFLLIDAAAENLNHTSIIEKIRSFNPTYVGITANVALEYAAILQAHFIKKALPSIKILFGGPLATAKSNFLIKKGFADIVVLGEGEETIIDLASIDPNDIQALRRIQGISFNTPNGIVSTERRPLIQDLDSIPFPKWDVFPRKGYQKSARAFPIYPLMTSRGCPYDCKNCTKIIHGYQLRYRSIKNILEELNYLKKIGAKEIAIEDDMFNFDLSRTKHLLLEIIKRKYNFKIQLSNGIRADKIDKDLSQLLYAAGVYRAAISIESGSQKVLEFLNKKLELKVVPPAIKLLKAAGIMVSGYFIIGLPVETYQSLIHTVDYANSLDLDIVVFLNLLVFPATRLYDYIEKNTDTCNESSTILRVMNYVHTPIQFSTPKMNRQIIKRVKTYNFIRSFINPRKFLRVVSAYTPLELTIQLIKYIRIFTTKSIEGLHRLNTDLQYR